MYILLFIVLAMAVQGQPSVRKLLIFGQDPTKLKEQLTILHTDSSGVSERDIVITIVQNEKDYKKYNVISGQFALLLIGKDGGEKLRSHTPVEKEAIFKLIDSMPMRQTEMNGKKH
jgi:hypothetical protein